jgi:hypothetical protein
MQQRRAVIRFLWAEGVPGAEIHHRLSAQYENSALPQGSVYEWITTFKNGRTSFTGEERPGLPSESTTEENSKRDRAMILDSLWVGVDEVAYDLRDSHCSAHGIIQVCARWVPKQLTGEPKRNRLIICQGLFNRYRNEGDAFWKALSLETRPWIHYYAPQSKCESMKWKHPTSPVKKKSKTQPLVGNMMLTL